MTTPTAPTPEGRVSMSALLGGTLLTEAKGGLKPTTTLLKDADVLALYFSASWCPPCKIFSPVLREFYLSAAKGNGLEIVYISSDKSVESFEEYVSVKCGDGTLRRRLITKAPVIEVMRWSTDQRFSWTVM
jgi:thiol-disulfide isomerase/thioredoxin